jgi:aerobic carbon-monoxide dehydrogenase large subunit
VLDKAVALADQAGFAGRRAASERAGRRRGLGIAYFMELAAPFNDRMEVRFDESGGVTIISGTHSHGQGHETVYAQMVADWLGVEGTCGSRMRRRKRSSGPTSGCTNVFRV